MTALRASKPDQYTSSLPNIRGGLPPLESPDWLTLQQAACEMGASSSTVRRMVRGGQLVNRMVPHRGGFAYLVFVAGSKHGERQSHGGKQKRRLWIVRGEDEAPAIAAASNGSQQTIAELERQVDQLSHALSRALRTKQRALPAGIGDPGVNAANPYARYRWLRRNRWWPF